MILDYNGTMHYSLHITAIGNPRAQTIVAHNIAGNRNVSLHYAQSLLETFPLVYLTDITKDDAEATLRQLTKIGVKAHIVPITTAMPVSLAPEELRKPATSPVQTPGQPPKPPCEVKPAPAVSFIYHEHGDKSSMKTKRVRWGRLVAGAVIVAIIALLASLAGQKWRLALRPSLSQDVSAHDGKEKRIGTIKAIDAKNIDSQTTRTMVSAPMKTLAKGLVDSGKTCGSDEGAVAFFKMAIGFNKYNVDAWYGLVNAYSRLGRTAEADTARQRMKKLFGEEVFAVSNIVERFGSLIDARPTAEGTYGIEYRSHETDTALLTHEIYQLVKSIGAICNCAALSLYAHGAETQGVLVFVKTDQLPASFDEFRSSATIRRLE